MQTKRAAVTGYFLLEVISSPSSDTGLKIHSDPRSLTAKQFNPWEETHPLHVDLTWDAVRSLLCFVVLKGCRGRCQVSSTAQTEARASFVADYFAVKRL